MGELLTQPSMDFYLRGVYLAFIISAIKVVISISALLSIRSRNFKKIGLYYSCMTGNYNGSQFKLWKFIIYLGYMLVLTPLFSWFSVVSAAWGVIAWLTNRPPTPERIKEIQFKMATVDLSKDQLIALQGEVNQILGIDQPIATDEASIESSDEVDPNCLSSEDEYGWYREVNVDPQKKTLSFYGHTPDYDGIYRSKYEYRFENGVMMARLMEKSSEDYADKEFEVKDNVVLESEIRRRHGTQKFHLTELDKKLTDLRIAVGWSEYKPYEVRYFVMSKHPEVFSSNDFNRIARQDLERLRTALNNVVSKAQESKAVIKELNGGFEIRIPDNCDAATKKIINDTFSEEYFRQMGLTSDELYGFKNYETTLLRWLGENPYTRFWSSLLSKTNKSPNIRPTEKSADKDCIGMEVLKIGVFYNYVLGRHEARVEVLIDGGKDSDDKNEEIFKKLSNHKDAIENTFGEPLEWINESYTRRCRIGKTIPGGGYVDEPSWSSIQDTLITKMMQLDKTFKPYIANLENSSNMASRT